MHSRVHPTALVDPSAELAPDVSVGPFCYVGPRVAVGSGTELIGHVTLLGPMRVGERNRVYPQACLGASPQDRSYSGEPTELVIGDDNEFREQVTVHRGTRRGGGRTIVGAHGLFMVGSHVAHDCRIGDRVTLANHTSLGGHVRVEDGAVCGGHVAVAPFVRIGALAFVAGGSMVERDVPPYVIVEGNRARVRGLNRVGVRRAGVPEDSERALGRAFRMLYGRRASFADALCAVDAELGSDPCVAELVAALRRSSERRQR